MAEIKLTLESSDGILKRAENITKVVYANVGGLTEHDYQSMAFRIAQVLDGYNKVDAQEHTNRNYKIPLSRRDDC